ncbi:pyridoxal phosphate-dependent aminotransferase [Burkholderia ubonensis]|uniref:pyridoxal phosphate-dependent aminotransferase n=1 Tax=Burkholderia ubonensis TaxID=101571 RepID=UPI0018DF2350|nr:pyridoxal phosphate-dependent aminotransferase [Burkholderia ubonensis]
MRHGRGRTGERTMTRINRYLANASPVSSKSIAQAARDDPAILNLSIGEPEFGPPEYALAGIGTIDLQPETYLPALKRYEHSRGSLVLRRAISNWYMRRYGLAADPESEILITHGGIEALNVALLSLTDPADRIALSDPGYALYARAIEVVGRQPVPIRRAAHGPCSADYAGCQVILVNSPENPTGHVLGNSDWDALASVAEANDAWVVHDEVYDTLCYARDHRPAKSLAALSERSVLVNSFSKKFGVPGLRVGWLVAPARVIDVAIRVHEALCLGVSELAESVALRLIEHPDADAWCDRQKVPLAAHNEAALHALGSSAGFRWPIVPMGGLFLFPDVTGIRRRLSARDDTPGGDDGSVVARYLLRNAKVAVVPGGVYGAAGRNHIRISTGGNRVLFLDALDRIAAACRALPACDTH